MAGAMTNVELTEEDQNVTLNLEAAPGGVAVRFTGAGTRRNQTVPLTIPMAVMGIPVGTTSGKFILEDENHATLTYQANGVSMSSPLRR